jgi:putative transcriptional regulator|nr:MAG TPA: putative transcriptional regulator [Bacteriophage sp.]
MKLNIKPLVDAKGLNRNQLSKELKIGYQATCNLYDGNAQRIYFDTLQRLCNVLECTPNDIFVFDKDDTN